MSSFRAFRAMAENEVRASVRNRTALIFTLGLAVLFMIIFGLLFGGSGLAVSFDAVNNDGTAASVTYLGALGGVSGVTVHTKSHATAFADLKDELDHRRPGDPEGLRGGAGGPGAAPAGGDLPGGRGLLVDRHRRRRGRQRDRRIRRARSPDRDA